MDHLSAVIQVGFRMIGSTTTPNSQFTAKSNKYYTPKGSPPEIWFVCTIDPLG